MSIIDKIIINLSFPTPCMSKISAYMKYLLFKRIVLMYAYHELSGIV